MFGLNPRTLYRWYRNYLSNYKKDCAEGNWTPEKLIQADEETGDVLSTEPVYVFKPENIGEQMSIDDKCIGNEGFTIMSDTKTGKIALMIESTKCEDVERALDLFSPEEVSQIKSISSDMSPTYLKASADKLPNAERVVDKFHVMQYVYDAVGEVKLSLKKELSGKLSKSKRKTEADKAVLYDLERLARSRHLLSQSADKWSGKATALMTELFEKHPQLKEAYLLAQEFKAWYARENAFISRMTIEENLYEWYERVEQSKIKEFSSVVKMIEKHETEILNFFNRCHTNASAERLNGKIQRFVSNNFGLRDKDFALYRIAGYFS
jgi:transposase